LNKVFLLGRLGSDAELKVTGSGASVLQFSLATSEKYTDKNNTKQEKTQWHRCKLWGDRATKLAQYLTKGSQIVVEGTIEYGSYEKDGVKHYTTDIKCFNVEFAGGGKKAESSEQSDDGDDLGPASSVGEDELPL
jgi:single-strand DNA-binding protein